MIDVATPHMLFAVWSGATFSDWEGAMGSCQARRMGR
jgi:hypothetical protein